MLTNSMKLLLTCLCCLLATPASAQIDPDALARAAAILTQQLATRTVYVPPGVDLQGAITAAKDGDNIELQPAAVYPPVKLTACHARDVTIRTRGPLPNRRLGMADVPLLAMIRSTDGRTPVDIPDGACHWKVDGIAVTQTGGNTYGLIRCGNADGHASIEAITHHVTIDRVVAFVADDMNERRGIQTNCSDLFVRRSSVLNIKEDKVSGGDSQAVGGWDTPGRIVLDDNDLQAATEVILFGGADPSIQGMTPTDIEITNNDITRPMAWRGSSWTVKNLLELKHARHVRSAGNRYSNNWAAAQSGYAFVITPRNQNGHCPWCVVADVVFENDIATNIGSAFNVLGSDDNNPSQPTSGIVIRNSRYLVDGKGLGAEGRCVQLIDGRLSGFVFDHNTCLADGTFLAVDGYGKGKFSGLVLTNNVAKHNLYGIIGTNHAPGVDTITAFFENPAIFRNVLAGVPAGTTYPATTLTPSLATFTAQFNLDGSMKASSSYKGAGTDGKDLGASLP